MLKIREAILHWCMPRSNKGITMVPVQQEVSPNFRTRPFFIRDDDFQISKPSQTCPLKQSEILQLHG